MPRVHDELIAQLYLHAKHDPKHEVSMKYECIAPDHIFKEKSPSKDHPSSDGILKLDWMHKHCSVVPSLMIFTAAFGTDWPAGEWIRRETTIIERITHLKHNMQQRDVKVILILMKFGHNTIDKDVLDERLNAIKRHCQLDSKSFVVLSSKDLATGLKDSMKRLTKAVRDFSAGYYVSQGKRLRGMERLIRPSEYLLIARMNFKVAFFYEFQLQMSRALRNYKQCYASLVDLHKLSKVKTEIMSQIKAVAELVNFKLCQMQLKSGSVKEASQQFRQHVKVFGASSSHFLWIDHAWAADQYLIYVSLLTHFSINTNHTDADRSYYYHRAALCTQMRQTAFQQRQRTNSVEEIETLFNKYSGLVAEEPKYFGSSPRYINNSTVPSKLTASSAVTGPPLDSTDFWSISLHYQFLAEEKVNHTDEILALLQKSLKNINPLHKRRKSHIRSLIAKQLMSIGDYDMASAHLSALIDFLHREQWSFCAIPVLRKKMLCAVYLGRPREYIPAALKLYKIAVLDEFFESEDRMELHRDVMSVIQNSEKPTAEFLEGIRDTDSKINDNNYVSLPLRPEYGAAAIDTHPPEYFLPDSYTVELGDLSNGLFQIDISYEKKAIEIGHHVVSHLSVTSLFQDVVCFTEMFAHFTDDVIIQKFVHTDGKSDVVNVETESTSTTNITHACLEFHPKVKTVFSFKMFIPETSLFKDDTNHICLERLVLIMSVPLPVQTSGEEVSALEDVECVVEDEIDDSLQMELELQQATETDPSLLLEHECANALTDESLALTTAMTLQLEDNVITTEDVTVDMQEESLDFPSDDRMKSADTDEFERKCSGELDEFSDNGECNDEENIAGNEGEQNEQEYNNDIEEIDEDGEGEQDDLQHHDYDTDDENPYDNNDDDITPCVSPSKGAVHSSGGNVNELNSTSDDILDGSTPMTMDQITENLDYEHDDDDDDEDDVDPNRMSVSGLGMMVPDLNKLDPVMPIVVDKEMQKSRSRSSSLTPSYAAELLSATTLTTAPPSTGSAMATSNFGRQSESALSSTNVDAVTPALSSPDDLSVNHHPRTLSLPPKLVQSTKNSNEAMRERGHREIVFTASAISKAFREARTSNFGVPARVKEVADFMDMQNSPKLLAVTPPISYLRMVSPVLDNDESICILQGTIQRLNFVFNGGEHEMLHGRIFVQSDYNQLRNNNNNSGDNHFFWYPNTTSFDFESANDYFSSQRNLDMIQFHPYSISGRDDQPVFPMKIEDQGLNSTFACPLFIKSDLQGDINIKIRVEYIPSVFLQKTTISKEFTVKVRVLKPFGMNFNISSLSDPHCGTDKKQGTTTVLRGDNIDLAATLDCVNSLASDVEVLVMTVMTKDATVFDEKIGATVDVPVFKIAQNDEAATMSNSDTVCDLLKCGTTYLPSKISANDNNSLSSRVVKSYITRREGDCQTIILKKGEAYVGSADIKCLAADNQLPSTSSVYTSIGDIITNWRVNDPLFFRPVDLTPYQSESRVKESDDSNASASSLSWLLQLDDAFTHDSGEGEEVVMSPLNTMVTHTRVCNMLFSVPKMQIVDAPFAVHIDTPTVALHGVHFNVHLQIYNKSNYLERVVMVAELTGDFLMTGGTYQVLEIAPNSEIAIELTLLPLVTGQVPLPHVCVTCERTKFTVLEFGTHAFPRHVFVKPVPVLLS